MSLKFLATNETVKETGDSLGATGLLDSDVYLATVTLAYLDKSEGGAHSLVVRLKTDSGKEIRQTFWMTNKTGQPFYEKDGEKTFLPGYIMANHLCMLTVEKEISDMDTEDKTIPLYNPKTKSEVPTKVPMLTDLIGQQIYAAIMKQTVDKTAKNTAGKYEPTGETREENEVDKFFRVSDQMTVAELRAGASEAIFMGQWKDKWAGKVRNKAKGAKAGATPGLPTGASAGAAAPKKSLFGN